MIVCAAASPSIDKLFVTGRLQAGEVHRPLEFLQLPGGKAINVARAARALGGRTRVVGLAGGHPGRWLADELEREGITARFAWSAAQTRSCLSVFDRARGQLTDFYERGDPVTTDEWSAFANAVADAVPGAEWLAIAGALPAGAPRDGFAQLVSLAHAHAIATAIDARGEALEAVLSEAPEVVKVNAAEAGEFVGRELNSADAAIEAAQALQEASVRGGGDGVQVVIVTRGREGAVMVGLDRGVWRGHLPIAGPYPVGSGDAFLAGLLLARERNLAWAECLAWALAAATANAEQPGAGRLDPARAAYLRSAVELERG